MIAKPDNRMMSTRVASRLAWGVWILTCCVALITFLFAFLNRSFPIPFCCAGVPAMLILSFIMAGITVGAVITSRRPGNSIGWILCSLGLLMSLWLFALHYAIYTGLTDPNSLPRGAMMAWIAQWLSVAGWGLIAPLFLLFPDGHLLSRRWWLVAASTTGTLVVTMICLAFIPGPLEWSVWVFSNPFGLEGALGTSLRKLLYVGYLLFIVSFLASVLSLISRFSKSVGVERQQIKWLAYAGAVLGLTFLSSVIFYGAAFWANTWVQAILFLSLIGLPLSVGIALLEYHLYDIDLIHELDAALTAFIMRQASRNQEQREDENRIPGSTANTALRGRWLIAARVTWVALAILTVGLFIVAIPGYASEISEYVRTGRNTVAPAWDILLYVSGSVASIASALLCLILAVVLIWRKPNERMAVFVSSYLLLFGAVLGGSLERTVTVWPEWEVQASAFAKPLLFATPTVGLLTLFPSGKFVPRWTRLLTFCSILLIPAIFSLPPYWWPDVSTPFASITAITWGTILLLALYAQIYRYRRVSNSTERQQTKWVVFGFFLWLLLVTVVSGPYAISYGSSPASPHPWWAPVVRAVWFLSSTILPISLTIAVMRYRLFDIDLLINRTLVYGALTASVVGLYIMIVGWFSIGLQTQNNLPAIVIATLVVAFLFRPLRHRLQRIADRFVPVPQPAWPLEQEEHKMAIPEGQGAADTTLRGRRRFLALAHKAWLICAALALLIFLAAIPLGYAQRFSGTFGVPIDAPGWYIAVMSVAQAVVSMLTALVCLALAALLFWKRRQEPMTLFVSFFLLVYGIVLAGPLEALNGLPLLSAAPPSHRSVVISAEAILQIQSALFAVMPLLFYLFPNGRFVPGWTRYPALLVLLLVPFMIRTFAADWPSTVTPFAWCYAALLGVGIYAQIYRYRRVATPLERQQTKWVVFGLALTVAIMGVLQIPYIAATSIPAGIAHPWWQPLTGLVWLLTLTILPLSLTVAVMRYRLWDIDIIINRALVYGTLTAIIVGIYVLIVGYLGVLFQASNNLAISLIATGLVAVVFQPLRQRLQRGINRMMYGERDDPYIVLSRLGQRLEAAYAPESVLPTIVETVAQTLKLPYVGILINQNGEFKMEAEFGRSNHTPINLPLIYQGEPVGELILAPRAPGDRFTPSERQLLDDLARQAGVAAHAMHLTADLQRSRERLVAAREEERRRLRRDLHDGLGPQLASLALKLETARNRMANDPDAVSLLTDLSLRTQEAVADIRRLVYALRPPALDELGLIMALREGATQYNQQGANGVSITFEAPERLPALPAAVEVAVYRIAQEALTNVLRHAEARTCSIHLRLDESAGVLYLQIQDDGKGLPMKRRAGVGLNSMRERAEELGGTLTITPIPTGGTNLLARLPCRLNEPSKMGDQEASVVSQEEV